jgi:hypothetical protein
MPSSKVHVSWEHLNDVTAIVIVEMDVLFRKTIVLTFPIACESAVNIERNTECPRTKCAQKSNGAGGLTMMGQCAA